MKKTIQLLSGAAGIMIVVTGIAAAQQLTVDISKVSDAGVGEKIGTVTIAENKQGTSFKVAVAASPPASTASTSMRRAIARPR